MTHQGADARADRADARAGATSPPAVDDLRVIPAKVRVPTARLDTVPRPRLLSRLDDERRRVVLVSAPAGSGKTVLLLDWLRGRAGATAWLSLDPLDNDPHRFFLHLAASLRRASDPAFHEAAAVLDDAPVTSAGRREAHLLSALGAADERSVVVLDDVHHLEAPSLVGLLDRLVVDLAPGPRLVLLTRVDPALRLGRLRVSGELLELRQRELRFTTEEAGELFRRSRDAGLDPELVTRLEERTEGWAAGLRLAAAALDRVEDPALAVEAFTGSHQLMVDYLLEEALGRQPQPLQRFLMETSILPRFTADACAAVTGDTGADRHLRAVDEANLFLVSLDDRGRWFRYHHLFAELLEFRLRRTSPDRIQALRERASAWFEEAGDVQEALRQASLLDRPSRLLELLDRHGYPILARSEFASFGRWLHPVPDPLEQPYPMFLVAVAWFRVQTERSPDLAAVLNAIERAIDAAPADYPTRRIDEARLHLDALRAFALRMSDRFEEALEVGGRVLERIPADAVAIRGVLEFNMGAVHLRLAEMAAARASLERAYDACLQGGIPYLVLASLGHLGAVSAQTEGVAAARQRLQAAVAFAEARGLAGLPAFAIILYQLAQVHYLADEPDAARAHLERALELAGDERETDIQANVLIHLARVESAAGRLDRADECLTSATALAHGHNVKPFATTLDVERARVAEIRHGRLQAPDAAPPSAEPGARWSTLREAEILLQLGHCLKLGLREDAGERAERLRRESEPRGRGVALAVAHLGRAAAARGARERHAALEAGLDLAARNGYVRPLLELGRPLRALVEAGLAGTSLSSGARTFARDLLGRLAAAEPPPTGRPATDAPPTVEPTTTQPPTAGPSTTTSAAAAGAPAEPPGVLPVPTGGDLTDRERTILSLLARGLTNKALARELYVSVNTVKTHLKRIFAKLDVSTRTEAAERARLLGLTESSPDGG